MYLKKLSTKKYVKYVSTNVIENSFKDLLLSFKSQTNLFYDQ